MANGKYKNLNNKEYWIKRTEEQVSKLWKQEGKIEKELAQQYRAVAGEIKESISQMYAEYSSDGLIDYAESQKMLTAVEVQAYQARINTLIQQYKTTGNEEFLLELDRLRNARKLNRMQARVNNIEAKLLELGYQEQQMIEAQLFSTYETNYYEAIFEIQKGLGVGTSFMKLNEEAIKTAITYPWSGDMFSDLIWDNKKRLVKDLRKTITEGLIRGEGYKKMARNLDATMDSGYKNSLRLVRTETAHVIAESTALGYEKSEIVKQYIIIATLDGRTSKICQHQDGKVYDLKDRKVGVNYPIFHANCRTTVAPYFGDGDLVDNERIARDLVTGKNYYVPASMTYQEWHKQYVEGR